MRKSAKERLEAAVPKIEYLLKEHDSNSYKKMVNFDIKDLTHTSIFIIYFEPDACIDYDALTKIRKITRCDFIFVDLFHSSIRIQFL